MSGLSDIERQQYFQVFSKLGPSPSGYLSGNQAKNWLLNSQLPVQWLERIWDLCDIDKDGQLDFDEFSVTCRLVNDLLSRVYPDVPSSLPSHLIPHSKAHLLAGNNTGYVSGGGPSLGMNPGLFSQQIISPIPQSVNTIPQINISNTIPSYQLSQQLPRVPTPPRQSSYSSFPTAPLSDDFDWYMPPADKFNYENEYKKQAGAHGYVRFADFDELYQRLGIPREECIAGWGLIDVNFEQRVGKDQCLVFLHILNQRSKGKRIPDSLPNALKTSLVRGKLNYNYNETADPSWKSKLSDSGSVKSSGYSESQSSSLRLEEDRLQKELDDLNEKIQKAETTALTSYTSALQSSGDSGVVVEFKQLYEYKQKKHAELVEKEKTNRTLEEYIRKERNHVRELQDNIQSLKNHVLLLENNLESSQTEYKNIQQEIDSAKLMR
ncbi:cytoskeletal-regulatory complex EF hand-domain-containing protein [Gigaspora margarita]|uniref:Endocytosis protein 3 n=1 Tax=Gigaspora margarita TaxID=4874 RepID=A0A8H3XGZ6_GIGMA|nr:cytoskeletal-regulatory complex EF hand-domain-containing protein [Gigaspora margarita]